MWMLCPFHSFNGRIETIQLQAPHQFPNGPCRMVWLNQPFHVQHLPAQLETIHRLNPRPRRDRMTDNEEIRRVCFTASGKMFVAMAYSVYASTDRGATWDKRGDYVPGGPQYYNQIFADPKNPERVYSVDVFMRVSDDGGIVRIRDLGRVELVACAVARAVQSPGSATLRLQRPDKANRLEEADLTALLEQVRTAGRSRPKT